MSLPSKEQMDQYVKSVEDIVATSIATATTDAQRLAYALRRLWHDISQYGPPEMPKLPEFHIPNLGLFEVPPPPPPPPPPPVTSWLEDATEWASHNRRLIGGVCIGAIGAGLLAGYGTAILMQTSVRGRRVGHSSSSVRRRVVVVLGGDTPLGPALVAGLEAAGMIVIASVSTTQAIEGLEKNGNGYVRALVLDPKEPSTLSYFIRSLRATLSLRFPINSPGDPYVSSPATFPYIHSIISLITLSPTTTPPLPAPLERLDFLNDYVSYLVETHLAPLQTIQAILPLLRFSHIRARDAHASEILSRSIVLCVPAKDAKSGMPFAAAQAMSAAATVRGTEVLRREIRDISRANEDADSMKDLKVVIVDVDSVASPSTSSTPEMRFRETMEQSMSEWTPSQRSLYGDSFKESFRAGDEHELLDDKPERVDQFVQTIVNYVAGPRRIDWQRLRLMSALKIWAYNLRTWLRGERFSIGASSYEYYVNGITSLVPKFIRDALPNIESYITSIRNALLPIPPRLPPVQPPKASVAPPAKPKISTSLTQPKPKKSHHDADHHVSDGSTEPPLSDTDLELSGASSEADIESSNGYASESGVGSSWVSLRDHEENNVNEE